MLAIVETIRELVEKIGTFIGIRSLDLPGNMPSTSNKCFGPVTSIIKRTKLLGCRLVRFEIENAQATGRDKRQRTGHQKAEQAWRSRRRSGEEPKHPYPRAPLRFVRHTRRRRRRTSISKTHAACVRTVVCKARGALTKPRTLRRTFNTRALPHITIKRTTRDAIVAARRARCDF